MAETARNDTKTAGLPVPVEARPTSVSFVRVETHATFVSQLLAERYEQQSRQTNSVRAATLYANGAKSTLKRMPMGFRKTVVA